MPLRRVAASANLPDLDYQCWCDEILGTMTNVRRIISDLRMKMSHAGLLVGRQGVTPNCQLLENLLEEELMAWNEAVQDVQRRRLSEHLSRSWSRATAAAGQVQVGGQKEACLIGLGQSQVSP